MGYAFGAAAWSLHPSATLWGIFSELLGRVGSSECQDEPQELVWAPHLQNCQDFWEHFWSHFGAREDAFSSSSRVRFQGRRRLALWSSSEPSRNSRRCSGAGKYRGEVDVTPFDIDAVTGASKLSFGLRWESLRELFCLLGGINSWVLNKVAWRRHRHRPQDLQVTIVAPDRDPQIYIYIYIYILESRARLDSFQILSPANTMRTFARTPMTMT